MSLLRCGACNGQKKIWGAGMISQYECKHCAGIGHVLPEMKIEDLPVNKEFEEVVEEKKAKVVVKKAVTKKAVLKPVQKPVIKKATTKKGLINDDI